MACWITSLHHQQLLTLQERDIDRVNVILCLGEERMPKFPLAKQCYLLVLNNSC